MRGLQLRPGQENGQTLVEYSLILAFVIVLSAIALAAITVLLLGYFDELVMGFG